MRNGDSDNIFGNDISDITTNIVPNKKQKKCLITYEKQLTVYFLSIMNYLMLVVMNLHQITIQFF